MPKPILRYVLAFLLHLLIIPPAVADQHEPWWHGSFLSEYLSEDLIKQGHARPFNCRDTESTPLKITADEISGYGFQCVITNVPKIPDYEIVIIKSDCDAWSEDEQLPSYKDERMFLLLEPLGRMLEYHRGIIGDYHLPFTIELSACEWRD